MTIATTSPDKNEFAVTLRGIFALDGDKLKLCFRLPPLGKRPIEIPANPTKEDNLVIWVLQRETAAPTTDEEKLQGDWKVVGGEIDGDKIDKSDDKDALISWLNGQLEEWEREAERSEPFFPFPASDAIGWIEETLNRLAA